MPSYVSPNLTTNNITPTLFFQLMSYVKKVDIISLENVSFSYNISVMVDMLIE